MILKASHHPVIYPFFQLYSYLKIRRNFREVNIIHDFRDKGLPILLISNHISWWDGFWVVYLNLKLLHRKYFFFMMLEEQLRKHMYLNKSGGFSIRKGSRSIVESLGYTAELLNDKNNLVLMFPQGKIESMHKQDIVFEKGIEYVLKKASVKPQVIFLVNLVDYFSDAKPQLYMYLREYNGTSFSTETLQKEFNFYYSECVAANISKSPE
jgi:hypothetical protein